MGSEQDASFVAFVEAASPRLLTAAWMLTGSAHAAEDLVQEALERTYVRWRRVRTTNPTAYARRIMANLNTDRWRKHRREVLSDTLPEQGAPRVHHDSRHLDLVNALQQLPPRERECVVLRHYLDLSEQLAAETLGVSGGTVKSSTSRGLAKLRVMLLEGEESYV